MAVVFHWVFISSSFQPPPFRLGPSPSFFTQTCSLFSLFVLVAWKMDFKAYFTMFQHFLSKTCFCPGSNGSFTSSRTWRSALTHPTEQASPSLQWEDDQAASPGPSQLVWEQPS